MSKKSFYITTTLPYVNAEPHIGFAMELIHADIIARWKKSQGYEVFLNTGTDEHGQKVFKAAQKENKDPQEYTNEYATKFRSLVELLGLDKDLVHFIRTTDEHHKMAAQEMWRRCKDAGFIEKKNYQIRYCVGCELEKTDSELVEGRCPLHPDRDLEIRVEENYFFRFSALADKLKNLYGRTDFVVPDYRLNEVRALIDRGLEDFSISRLKEKMSWGISVPDDEAHVMYVWFDALTNYISTLGWPDDEEKFKEFWNGESNVQFAGKDQVRQQAAMWQAMLLAADLPPTAHIVIHGFLNLGGQKMSKSLGNVLSPQEMIEKFGLEAFRAMMAGMNQFEDTEVSVEGFVTTYNGYLANGLGNLVARIMKLAETNLEAPVEYEHAFHSTLKDHMEKFEIQKAISHIWSEVGELDKEIQEKKPWETKDKTVITELVKKLAHIGHSLAAFMPDTSEKIIQAIKQNKLEQNLFPRHS